MTWRSFSLLSDAALLPLSPGVSPSPPPGQDVQDLYATPSQDQTLEPFCFSFKTTFPPPLRRLGTGLSFRLERTPSRFPGRGQCLPRSQIAPRPPRGEEGRR